MSGLKQLMILTGIVNVWWWWTFFSDSGRQMIKVLNCDILFKPSDYLWLYVFTSCHYHKLNPLWWNVTCVTLLCSCCSSLRELLFDRDAVFEAVVCGTVFPLFGPTRCALWPPAVYFHTYILRVQDGVLLNHHISCCLTKKLEESLTTLWHDWLFHEQFICNDLDFSETTTNRVKIYKRPGCRLQTACLCQKNDWSD